MKNIFISLFMILIAITLFGCKVNKQNSVEDDSKATSESMIDKDMNSDAMEENDDAVMMEKDDTMIEESDVSVPSKIEGMEKEEVKNQKMMEQEQDDSSPITYAGTVLAGSNAKLLDFTKDDYNKALNTGKPIVLYFYADWCPICKAEIPHLYGAFNELTTDQIIGFRVNFNDKFTDSDEKELARQFGVAYQHTKVFLKNGQRVLKSPETWKKDRYLSEISSLL